MFTCIVPTLILEEVTGCSIEQKLVKEAGLVCSIVLQNAKPALVTADGTLTTNETEKVELSSNYFHRFS